jgi:hypothetical protein
MKPGNRPIENLTANFCQIFERPNMALARLDNRIAAAKAVMNDAQIARSRNGAAIGGMGSVAGAIVTYLQQGAGVGVLIFLIAAVALGTVAAAALRPRKEPLTEGEPPISKTQSAEVRTAFGTLEHLLAAAPGDELLTDLLAAMLAGRTMLDSALGRMGDLIRARAQQDFELLAQIPGSGPVLGLDGVMPAPGIGVVGQSENANYFLNGPEH